MEGHAAPLAKTLRTLSTACIVFFCVELAFAVVGSFLPAGRLGVLYPVFLGLDPWSLATLSLNVTLLAVALGALYFAEKLERDAYYEKHVSPHRKPHQRTPRLTQ